MSIALFKSIETSYIALVKYPIFALFGIVLAAGCFNPQLKNGGFACTGTQDGQCPQGFYCVNNLCVDSPSGGGGGVGGGGNVQPDLSMAMSVDDMATPSKPQGKPDMAKPIAVADMAKAIVPPDMTMPPPPDMVIVNSCAHDICTTGVKLKSSCDPCVTLVCQHDTYCCSSGGQWDDNCVSETDKYCSASEQC